MKFSIKITQLALIVALMASIVVACKKEEDNARDCSGTPQIDYIRSTDPGKSDSLLVGSFMGSLIAIIGENLCHAEEMWFNDQKAVLNPTFVTENSILVNVPSTVPTEVNNKIRVVFNDGSELLYDFKVNVPAPTVDRVKCEYVPDGGTLVLDGDFFFAPIKVVFAGDKEAEVLVLDKTHLEVKVPVGAEVGQISVETNFGKAKSKFIFRDDRNILLDYDGKNHETWTAAISGSNPEGCSGNYAQFKHPADAAWMWTNELTMQYWAPRGRGNVPVATGLVNDLALKFEVNIIEWRDVRMEIFFNTYAEDHGRDANVHARYQPWKTGKTQSDGWETVTIPLKDFKYGKDDSDDNGTRSIDNLSSLTNITMMLFGPAAGPNPVNVCVDNVRIVPL